MSQDVIELVLRLGGVRRSLPLSRALLGGVRERLEEDWRRRAVRERDGERDLDREDEARDSANLPR